MSEIMIWSIVLWNKGDFDTRIPSAQGSIHSQTLNSYADLEREQNPLGWRLLFSKFDPWLVSGTWLLIRFGFDKIVDLSLYHLHKQCDLWRKLASPTPTPPAHYGGGVVVSHWGFNLHDFISFGYILGRGLLYHIVILFLIFWWTSILLIICLMINEIDYQVMINRCLDSLFSEVPV